MATVLTFGSLMISSSLDVAYWKPNFLPECWACNPPEEQMPTSSMSPAFLMEGRRTELANNPAPSTPSLQAAGLWLGLLNLTTFELSKFSTACGYVSNTPRNFSF